MVGGFLGAGKTTSIARLAQRFIDQGQHVAIVTNDQAYNLVDTHTLRAKGFSVGEVPGACFCCKFDELVKITQQLSEESLPDIIIAEPVGSCTDLFATVVEPMRHLYGERFVLGPLIVLLKPEHGLRILRNVERGGFSPKAAYIFLKQLEEADTIVINKIDKLSPEVRDELTTLLEQRFPQTRLVRASAIDGAGFDELHDIALQELKSRSQSMEMDYDDYAEGEAELGWLNCQIDARSSEKFDLDSLVLGLVERIRNKLVAAGAEIAHLKILGQSVTESAIANSVDSQSEPELSLASEIRTDQADVLVNARVAVDPESMEQDIRVAAAELGDSLGIDLTVSGLQCFRPGRPEPTHRFGGSP